MNIWEKFYGAFRYARTEESWLAETVAIWLLLSIVVPVATSCVVYLWYMFIGNEEGFAAYGFAKLWLMPTEWMSPTPLPWLNLFSLGLAIYHSNRKWLRLSAICALIMGWAFPMVDLLFYKLL